MQTLRTCAFAVLLLLFSPILSFCQTGRIEGKIVPAERLESVKVVSEDGTKYPAFIDRSTGSFSIPRLPFGRYRLILQTSIGRIEGVDLRPLELIEGVDKPLSEHSRQWIESFVKKVRTYENKKRILFLEGKANSAVAVVELLRDLPTTFDKPQNRTWRVEKWYFVKEFGGWRKHSSEVIVRKMFSPSAFDGLSWTFEPMLGGIELSEVSPSCEIDYTIPEEPDPAKGKVPLK